MDCHIPLSYSEVSLYILPLQELVKSSDDVRREWPREGDSVDGIMGSNVDITSFVGDKEEQLQLKQLVEAHHIDIP